jgi:hypothetical protein
MIVDKYGKCVRKFMCMYVLQSSLTTTTVNCALVLAPNVILMIFQIIIESLHIVNHLPQ